VKNTVPPGTFAPVGAVGAVSPGPVVGTAELDGVEALVEVVLELDPQALMINTTRPAAIAASVVRANFLMLNILLRINARPAGTR